MKFFLLSMLISCASLSFAGQGMMDSDEVGAEQSVSSVDPVGRSLYAKELSSPARFQKIKIEDPLEEIQFWARQMSEHALFLHLGMEDEAFKKRGLALHKKFEAFRKNLNENNACRILPLTKELRAYKVDVFRALEAGKWIGWIFPSFAKHITQELDYFIDKLNGVEYSTQDELDFWNHINSDHAAFAAHLFDITERELSQKAQELSDRIAQLPESEEDMFIRLSLTAAKELDQLNKQGSELIKKNKIRSIIHPVLLDHVIREGERSKQKLMELNRTGETEGTK